MTTFRYSCKLAFALLLLFLPQLAHGEAPIKVEEGWVQAVPPVSAESVAYLKLINRSDQPLQLTAARTPIAERVISMLMVKQEKNGQEMIGMEQVDTLTVPAHGSLELKPDGAHLMLMGLKEHPRPGAKITLTLHFEPGGAELDK